MRISRTGLKQIFYGGDDDTTRNYEVIRQDVMGAAFNTNVYMPANAITFHESYTEVSLKREESSTQRQKVKA